MKKYFKLSIISLLLIFVTLPKIVLATNVSDTHDIETKTLSNGKTLLIYVPKSKSYTNILVHFHGWYEDTVNSAGITALEEAMKEYDYSKTVVFFPIDGICNYDKNVLNTVNKTVDLIYDEYQNFLRKHNISNHELTVSQFSGTSYAANRFINKLENKKINLFLFDSTSPSTTYNSTSLKKIDNLIMISELMDNSYSVSAEAFGKKFRDVNKTGTLKHFIDDRHEHGYADDVGFKVYMDYINNKGKISDNLDDYIKSSGSGTGNTGSGTSSGTTSGGQTTTPSEDNNNTIYGGGKDTGTTTIGDSEPRLTYDNICESEGFKTASKIAGIVILVAKWLGPLILMIMGMIDFFKAVISSSDKALSDATGTFIKRMIIAIITPIIPGLLYYLVDFLIGEEINGKKIDFGECTDCLKSPLGCKVTLYDYDDQRGESN